MDDIEKSGANPSPGPARIVIAESDPRKDSYAQGGHDQEYRRRRSSVRRGRLSMSDDITPVSGSGATTVPIEYRTL
jgi:hypothetical protein